MRLGYYLFNKFLLTYLIPCSHTEALSMQIYVNFLYFPMIFPQIFFKRESFL